MCGSGLAVGPQCPGVSQQMRTVAGGLPTGNFLGLSVPRVDGIDAPSGRNGSRSERRARCGCDGRIATPPSTKQRDR